jgi:hypothetical protein
MTHKTRERESYCDFGVFWCILWKRERDEREMIDKMRERERDRDRHKVTVTFLLKIS